MRINEWNEELVEMFEAWVVLRASEGANVDDLRYIVTIARAQHQAANDLRAQLAQRDAELAAALLDVARMRDTQKDMGSLDDAVAAILRRYPDDPYADYLTSRLEDSVKPRAAELVALREKVAEWEAFGKFAMAGDARSFLETILPADLSDDQEGRGRQALGEAARREDLQEQMRKGDL